MRDKQYNKTLTPDTAAEGMKAALENAKSLYEDAVILFQNNRYPRATALAILAIEEAGKLSILRLILLSDDPIELKKNWQDYRRHTYKNANWIVPELILKGARHFDQMYKVVDDKSDHRKTLDNLKQLCFYSDVFSNCKWSSPDNLVSKEVAESIIEIAKIMAGKEKASMSTKQELELWVKHLKPVYNSDASELKKALANCYAEAEELGFIDKGAAGQMATFVGI
jgi:AbiV family abortive infection protein